MTKPLKPDDVIFVHSNTGTQILKEAQATSGTLPDGMELRRGEIGTLDSGISILPGHTVVSSGTVAPACFTHTQVICDWENKSGLIPEYGRVTLVTDSYKPPAQRPARNKAQWKRERRGR